MCDVCPNTDIQQSRHGVFTQDLRECVWGQVADSVGIKAELIKKNVYLMHHKCWYFKAPRDQISSPRTYKLVKLSLRKAIRRLSIIYTHSVIISP